MHKSKFLALLLAIAMVVSMVVVPVYAEGELSKYTLTADKTTVAPGEQVTVTLTVEAAGLAGFDLSVDYDKTMILKGSIAELAGLKLSPADELDAPQKVIYTDLETLEGTVKLVTYTFTAPTAAGVYAITVKSDEGSNINFDEETFAPTYGEELNITVLPDPNGVEWTSVAGTDWSAGKTITNGFYKLSEAITLAEGETLTIGKNQVVYIDLNGQTITGSTARTFVVSAGAYLMIKDSATGGTITDGSVDNGSGGNIFVSTDATLTLVSGTISGGQLSSTNADYNTRGGNIYGQAGSTINIQGGEVKGGVVDRSAVGAKTSSIQGGGNIASLGTVNISGGTISGGQVLLSSNTADSGLYGGNILAYGSVLNITGGEVNDGLVKATAPTDSTDAIRAHGGNIYAYNATVTITDATVSGGKAEIAAGTKINPQTFGGNIFVNDSSMTINGSAIVKDGVVDDTKNRGYAGNIYIQNGSVTLSDNAKITGGTCDYYGGSVTVNADSSLTLEDNAIIEGGTATGGSATIYAAGTASADAQIIVKDKAQILAGAGGSASYGDALTAYQNTDIVVYGGNIGETSAHKNTVTFTLYNGVVNMLKDYSAYTTIPACAAATVNGYVYTAAQRNLDENNYCAVCDHTYVQPESYIHNYVQQGDGSYLCTDEGCGLTLDNTWQVFDANVTAPSGNYIMLEDVTTTGNITIANGTTFVLDMNGHTLKQTGGQIDNSGTTTIKNGTITDGYATSKYCGNIKTATGTCNLINCTITNGGGKDTKGYGGNVGVGSGTANITGCVITNGSAGDCGGNVYAFGCTLNISDSFISGGKVNTGEGGNIFYEGASGTMTNVVVSGGVSTQGANMMVAGYKGKTTAVTVNGGTFIGAENSNANYGGNIYFSANANTTATTLDINNATLKDGHAAISGGNLYTYKGAVTVTNTTISGGEAGEDGGNIGAETMTSLSLTNCAVSGGKAVYGGNLAVMGSGGEITVTGGSYTDGTVAKGTVDSKTASGYGGNIYASTGTVSVSGATISGGNADTRGGNICVNGAGICTFTNCAVSNGFSERGGNLAVLNSGAGTAEVTINGGTFDNTGVTGINRGGNLFAQYYNADTTKYSLTVDGGAKIIGGQSIYNGDKAFNDGGNLCMIYASAHLIDCEISGGYALSEGGNITVIGSSTGSDGKPWNSTLVIEKDVVISGGTVGEDVKSDILIRSAMDETSSNLITMNAGATVGHVEAYDEYTLTVEAGVISDNVLSGTLTTMPSVKDSETGKYTTYADLDAAIAATDAADDVVALGEATTADFAEYNYTLDLNGQTLTGNVSALDANAKVIDSTEGAGLVAGEVTVFTGSTNGGYLPVPVEGGYRFETVELQQKTMTNDSNTKLKFIFADAADETLLDDAIVNGDEVMIKVTVTWDGGSAEGKCAASVLQAYASAWGTKMFTCSINGVENVEIQSITASVYSCGVQIDAVDLTNN